MKSVRGKYRAWRRRARREVGFFWILQPCLASSAILNSWILRKPKPPASLERQRVFYATQCSFHPSEVPPHQNRLVARSTASLVAIGISKQLIRHVGMDWMTDLIKTSRPAWESCFSSHPNNLLQIRSLTGANIACRLRLKAAGSPRYFSCAGVSTILRVERIAARVCAETALLKKNSDLSRLTFCPDTPSYPCRMLQMMEASAVLAREKIRLSSA